MKVVNKTFLKEIEDLVSEKKISYLEAVLLWCEDHSYPEEQAAVLIKRDPVLTAKIKGDAQSLNFLKKDTDTLPI